MKNFYWVCAIALAVSITSCTSSNQEPSKHTESLPKEELKRAVKSLQQVDSSINVGTNIGNYASQITNAKTEVDTYLLKDNKSETAKKVESLLNRHLVALNWWKCDLSEDESSIKDKYEVASECRDNLLPEIFKLSPNIKKDAERAIAAKPMRHKSDSLDKSAMLQLIWEGTSKDTKNLLGELTTNAIAPHNS